MLKYSTSVSSNSIAQFLNFALKIRNRKYNPIGIGDEGAGFVAMLKVGFNMKVFRSSSNLCVWRYTEQSCGLERSFNGPFYS